MILGPYTNILLHERLLQNGNFWVDMHHKRDLTVTSVWNEYSQENPVYAAAAAPNHDWFAKYPSWLRDVRLKGVLVDAGCGYGRISIPMLQQNPELYVIGIDASDVMLTTYHRLICEYPGLEKRVCLIQGNLYDLPIRDETLDAVLSVAVLLHNSYTTTATIIHELFRCLKPGGAAWFSSSFPNVFNLEGLQNVLYARFLAGDRNGPVRPYTRGQISSLLQPYCTPASLEIWSNQVILLPRQIGIWSWSPYMRCAQWMRDEASRHYAVRRLANTSGIGASIWEVRCQKMLTTP